MRILYYFAERPSFMYQWQRVHIFDELSHHGVSVDVYNPLQTPDGECDLERFCNHLERNHDYDLFMTCHGDERISPDYLSAVRKYGMPSLLICFDNLHEPFAHRKIACQFDLVWLTSRETEHMFGGWGCKNILTQTYAANPYLFANQADKCLTSLASVCFIGTPYGSRVNKINLLAKGDVCVDLYHSVGGGETSNATEAIRNWVSNKSTLKKVLPYLSFDIGRKVAYSAVLNKVFKKESALSETSSIRHYPSLSFEEMIDVYRRTSLSLNITELRNTYVLKTPVHKMHLRTFEIPMSGGLEFCSYTDELSGYFEDGKEIVMYESEDELLDKARYYTDPKHFSIVDKMKQNAVERSVRDHTWYKRFENVFDTLRLKNDC